MKKYQLVLALKNFAFVNGQQGYLFYQHFRAAFPPYFCAKKNIAKFQVQTFANTGGPRNSRTFYLQIRLFAVGNFIPKFQICDLVYRSLAYSRLLNLL